MKATPKRVGRRLPLAVLVALVLAGGALIGLAALMGLNWLLRSEPLWSLPTPPTQPGRPEPLEIVKIALTIVAGVGGLVALTVGYRRQLWLEADAAGHRERQKALHDRYGAAVTQLGHDSANVRLAGVYALANLADEWSAQRQQCVDVLCAYLRVPWDPDPDKGHPTARKVIQSPGPRRATVTYTYPSGLGESEVRRTIVRVIAAHLRSVATVDGVQRPGAWSDMKLDFTSAALPEADFTGCTFSDAIFLGTQFLNSVTSFEDAIFSGRSTFNESIFRGWANFGKATFLVSVEFKRTEFSNAAFFPDVAFRGEAAFMHARFAGGATFSGAVFSSSACFIDAEFTSRAHFDDTKFMGITLFQKSRFLDGPSLGGIILSCEVSCRGAKFTHAPPGELCVATADEEEAPPPGLEGQ